AFDLQVVVPGIEEPPLGPNAQPKTIDVEMHLLVMSDGNQTWMGFAFDRDALATLMAGLKGAGKGPNLSTVAAIKHLENETHAGVSVATLNSAIDAIKPIAAALGPIIGGPVATQALNVLEQLPNQ